ncbi:MAG: hypothetical protein R3321_08855, partial [Nitrososphaeraceae archaeon]|nr:hypothetical protein [Nitrososphaeraceae archaeon]
MQTRQDQEQQEQHNNNQYYYSNFINSLKTQNTKINYKRRLSYFMTFLGIKEGEYSKLVDGLDKKRIEDNIKSFLVYLRQQKGGVSYQSGSHYLNAIKKFYYVNTEFDFRWQ